jgi:hypothetical protein
MDHDRTGKIMEAVTECTFKPGLDAEIAVPVHALENRVDEADQD